MPPTSGIGFAVACQLTQEASKGGDGHHSVGQRLGKDAVSTNK
jgi:hypothetical protein